MGGGDGRLTIRGVACPPVDPSLDLGAVRCHVIHTSHRLVGLLELLAGLALSRVVFGDPPFVLMQTNV